MDVVVVCVSQFCVGVLLCPCPFIPCLWILYTHACDLFVPWQAKSAAAAADREVPIRGIQKAMFAQMTIANSVPHFGYSDEVKELAILC